LNSFGFGNNKHFQRWIEGYNLIFVVVVDICIVRVVCCLGLVHPNKEMGCCKKEVVVDKLSDR
jgi:hypothetical protein